MLINELNTKNVQFLVFREQKRIGKQKYSEKKTKIILKVDLNTDISITTLNVNDLKASIKREIVRLDLKSKIKLYAIYKNPL